MPSWQSGDVTVKGIKIPFTRTGVTGVTGVTGGATGIGGTGGIKPSLVLAHGAHDSGLCWTRLARALEDDFDVVMPDSRGHGRSEAPHDGYSSAEDAADLAGLIEALNLDRPVVGGHSMGAGTAARFAADYPDMLRAAILEDPGFLAEPLAEARTAERAERGRQAAEANRSKTRDQLIAEARRQHPTWHEDELGPWADAKRTVDPRFVGHPRRRNNWVEWRALLPKIRVPVLMITADPDKGGIVTPEVAAEAQRLLPSLRVVHLPGAGHSVRRDQFGPFLDAVRGFLRDVA